MSPLLRLRSAYHRIWYEFSESVRWSTGKYQETPAGTLGELDPHQRTRVERLLKRYGVRFETDVEARIAMANYAYLDMLDLARESFEWVPKPGRDLIDIGSQHFYYAPTLAAFYHPKRLLGIELEGYRLYTDGHSRSDYASYYTSLVPNASFVPMDFCKYQGRADNLTCFFPFVTPEALVAWRLPLMVFQPHNMFRHMMTCLRPAGTLLMVNHGEREAAIASTLARDCGFAMCGHLPYDDPLVERSDTPVVSLWKKSETSSG